MNFPCADGVKHGDGRWVYSKECFTMVLKAIVRHENIPSIFKINFLLQHHLASKFKKIKSRHLSRGTAIDLDI